MGEQSARLLIAVMGMMNHWILAKYRTIAVAILCLGVLVLPNAAQENSSAPPPQEEMSTTDRVVEPLSTSVPGAVDPEVYRIGAEDVIGVRVWREPELTLQQTVRPDGKITMPLIGDVLADGATPKELSATITTRLKEFINNPNVMVTVMQVRSKKYTITGEVGRPGSYPLLLKTTVLDAITNAGGFRDFANRKNVTVIRGDERLKFNYNDVIKGKNMDQNIELRDGDLVVIP